MVCLLQPTPSAWAEASVLQKWRHRSMDKPKTTKQVGITHFPLEQERARQEKVAHVPVEAGPAANRGLAHELEALDEPVEPEAGPASKSAKGGKTRGSRAGLLSASRKVKEKK